MSSPLDMLSNLLKDQICSIPSHILVHLLCVGLPYEYLRSVISVTSKTLSEIDTMITTLRMGKERHSDHLVTYPQVAMVGQALKSDSLTRTGL